MLDDRVRIGHNAILPSAGASLLGTIATEWCRARLMST